MISSDAEEAVEAAEDVLQRLNEEDEDTEDEDGKRTRVLRNENGYFSSLKQGKKRD